MPHRSGTVDRDDHQLKEEEKMRTNYIFIKKRHLIERPALMLWLGALGVIIAAMLLAHGIRAWAEDEIPVLDAPPETTSARLVEIEDRMVDLDALDTVERRVEPLAVPETTPVTERLTQAPEIIRNYYDIPLSHDVQDYMFQECSRYNIPSGLVVAIMETESGFTPDIISRTGDYGLMQINECSHEWLYNNLGVTNLLDAKQNILAGIYILRYHLDRCDGGIRKALMCYACGAGRAEFYFKQGIYDTDYTRDLLDRADRWEATLGW
jgi:hypothetical protein